MLPHPSGPGQGVPVPALSSALGIGKKTHGKRTTANQTIEWESNMINTI